MEKILKSKEDKRENHKPVPILQILAFVAVFGFGAWQATKWLVKDEPYEHKHGLTLEQLKKRNEVESEERLEDIMRRGEEAWLKGLQDRYDAGLVTAEVYLDEVQRVKRAQYERKNQD